MSEPHQRVSSKRIIEISEAPKKTVKLNSENSQKSTFSPLFGVFLFLFAAGAGVGGYFLWSKSGKSTRSNLSVSVQENNPNSKFFGVVRSVSLDGNVVFRSNSEVTNGKPTFPNIAYIGAGYDLLQGNPHSITTSDPGFKAKSIFQFSYLQDKVTGDNKFRVPDGISVLPAVSCSYDSQVSEITDENSYLEDLSKSASVDASITVPTKFSGSFSFSKSYQEVSNGVTSNREVIYRSKAQCIQFQASADDYLPPKLNLDFQSGVLGLSDSVGQVDRNKVIALIESYGTHFVVNAYMGSQVIAESTFTEDSYFKLKKENADLQVGCSVSFKHMNPSFGYSSKSEEESGKSFEENRSSVRYSYIGSKPSNDSSILSWATESHEFPFPINYKLRPITTVINTNFIPSLKNAASVASQVQAIIDDWCVTKQGTKCIPAPSPVRTRDVFTMPFTDEAKNSGESNVLGSKTCPIGSVPIWVGFDRATTGTSNQFPRYFVNQKSVGYCDSPNGATCQLRCAYVSLFDVKVVKSSGVSAQCPKGYVVTGCGASGTSSAYPSIKNDCASDGNGDTYATCIVESKVKNYEVVKVTATGTMFATCKAGTTVLGCGYTSGTVDSYYSVYVHELKSSLKACAAYNSHGATVYAICGTLTE